MATRRTCPFISNRFKFIIGVYAFNSDLKGHESVFVQMQGEDDVIASYIDFVRSQYPEHAEVEEIIERDFKGHVEDAYKFVQPLQFEQIAKAVSYFESKGWNDV